MSAYIRKQYGVLKSFLLGIALALMSLCSIAVALTPLSDKQMQDVDAQGLAFAFDDFRFQMEPTSFFENIGEVPNKTVSDATNGFKGDYRWIGTTITSGVGNSGNAGELFGFADYIDTANGGVFKANPGSSYMASGDILDYTDQRGVTRTMSLPIAKGGAQGYAEINNPFVLRVRSHDAVGLARDGDATPNEWIPGQALTAIELVGATNSDYFRWAFWGEVDAVKDTFDPATDLLKPGVVKDASLIDGTTAGRLTNQEIILGAPVSRFRPDGKAPAGDGTGIEIACTTATGPTNCSNYKVVGPVFRMYQSMGEGKNDRTLGMLYHHRLSGSYRFSVNQKGSVTAAGGKEIPQFDGREGMYFTHVNAYLPMGQLHYQSLIVTGVVDGSGNYTGDFITETSLVPDDPAAYNDFYGFPGWGDNVPTKTQLQTIAYGYERNQWSDRYYETHGYVRWGDNFPTKSEFVTEIGSGNAANITNHLSGNGVGGTYGYSSSAGANGDGVTTGNNVNVTYHLKPLAINDTNILNIYHSGLSTVSIGLCQNSRDKYCNSMSGSTIDVQRTISVPVATGTPVGQGTASQLLSEGGMIFLARDGGSWTVPQNPNLAAEIASAGVNATILGNWEIKEELTSTSDYNCNWQGECDWELFADTSPDYNALDTEALNVINANGGATATLQINGINLGSSRVEGMLIHHLKVTTLGAAN